MIDFDSACSGLVVGRQDGMCTRREGPVELCSFGLEFHGCVVAVAHHGVVLRVDGAWVHEWAPVAVVTGGNGKLLMWGSGRLEAYPGGLPVVWGG